MQQDIRHLKLPQKFDAAVAMFAVMGYQTKNQDFEDALTSVHRHLNPGGLFVFDVWFGPAVLMQKPGDRIKIIENDGEKIIRLTRSKLDIMKHTVDVNFNVMRISDKTIHESIEETHRMRFFFPMELNYFFEKNGFEVLKMIPFMEINGILSEDNWNMTVVARRIK